MHLTIHTDYALRTLMVLAVASPEKVRTVDISQAFEISEHHLVKVIQHLARLGLVETTRGQSGGVRLLRAASEINVGHVVREMEADLGVVACLRKDGQECFISPVCGLKTVLHQATQSFLAHLDAVTLDQLIGPRGQKLSPLRRSLESRIPH